MVLINKFFQAQNNMKYIISRLFSTCILSMVLLSSCSKDDAPSPEPSPEPDSSSQTKTFIKLEFSGITVFGRFHNECRIPSEGVEFTSVGKDEYKDFAFVNQVYVGDFPVGEGKIVWNNPTPPPYNSSVKPTSGEWGSFKYLSEKSPYDIEYHINPNNSGLERNVIFTYGEGMYESKLVLIQPPVKNQTSTD